MDKERMKKVLAWIAAGYVALVLLFYYSAGEQLFIRDSKHNIGISAGDVTTQELLDQDTVSQVFISEMDKLDRVTIRLATFGRANTGAAVVRLLDAQSGSELFRYELDLISLADGADTVIPVNPLVEGLRDRRLKLEITVPGGIPGNSVAPWYNSHEAEDGWQLYQNGQAVPGVLCFGTEGRDLVWTGPHYWQIAGAGAAALAGCIAVILYRVHQGKRSLVLNAVNALTKYRFLMEQLVSRDFKTKYKRSVLGVLWSFLNPLLTMTVQYVVFSTIFKSDITNYPVYLLTGIVLFGFFSESTGMSLMSILGNASLITKVYVPKYIYPVTRVLSSTVNLMISLVPLLIMILFTRTLLTKAYILLIFPLVCLILFCIGMAFLLSSSMVFFRDTQFLWSVFSLLWMYATPIFYPESILPPEFTIVHRINPMYYFIKFARIVIIDGISPEPRMYLLCAAFALGFLAVGAFVFKKSQDKFVFYI